MINYEQDFYGWTQEQATLLREGKLNALDITNLIEQWDEVKNGNCKAV
jgi:hypothetical protein